MSERQKVLGFMDTLIGQSMWLYDFTDMIFRGLNPAGI